MQFISGDEGGGEVAEHEILFSDTLLNSNKIRFMEISERSISIGKFPGFYILLETVTQLAY